MISFLVLFCLASGCAALMMRPLPAFSRTQALRVTFEGRNGFLCEKDPFYRQVIITNTMTALKQAIADGKKLLEVEFPPSKVNDISVTETLDVTRSMLLEMLNGLSVIYPGESMYTVWPDRGECALAIRNGYGEQTPWKMAIINEILQSPTDSEAQCMVFFCPGFNVNEWIDISALESKYPATTFIVVNGNLDRLRSNYYPSFFYPKLASVGKSFYSRFTQAFFLSPVAVLGDRFGSWIATQYPGQWELLVLQPGEKQYDVMQSSEKPFESQKAWKEATKLYKERTGRMF